MRCCCGGVHVNAAIRPDLWQLLPAHVRLSQGDKPAQELLLNVAPRGFYRDFTRECALPALVAAVH